jgi:hypothetical protein
MKLEFISLLAIGNVLQICNNSSSGIGGGSSSSSKSSSSSISLWKMFIAYKNILC